MALATLAKGPVGFILPLFATLFFLLVQKDWKGIKAMRLHLGLPLLLGVVLAWYLPAVLKGGMDYFNTTLLHNVVDRFAKGSSHIRPFYYYFSNFPVDYLPWFIFLPGAIVYGFSKGMKAKKREFLFLMVWFVFIFTFFSLSKGKRGLYLLPLFPAASIMIGKLWEDFMSFSTKHFQKKWVTIPLFLLIGVILLAGVALPLVFSVRLPFNQLELPPNLPYTFSDSVPVAFFLIALSVSLILVKRMKNYRTVFFLIIIMMTGGFFYTLRVVFPLINPYKSARFICQEITSRIQPGESLAIFGDFEPGPYNFYTGIVPIIVLEEEEALFDLLKSPGRVFCLFRLRDFLRFERMEGVPKFQFITRRPVGDTDFVLISNR
jgi:4-amino-4-deoxy-L-arabinose transferase-like glycosyltransferase